MCGILAKASVRDDEIPAGTFDTALQTLAHRGPDGSRSLHFPFCVLGQTRLSIIDLATGDQPMQDLENKTVITFNGEIYNYKELRVELEKKGHIFKTQSDTEVILKAYAEYGEECPKYLDGMFAFAVWDTKSKELFIARDRFGKKPLYYHLEKGELSIASEIKALKALGIHLEIDPIAIDDFLKLMYVPPWRSIYKNVHTLFPAHCGVFKDGELKIRRYWELTDAPSNPSYNEAKEEVQRLLKDAVRKRMIADVEIGSFLSGGVDSTLVTAYATEHTSKPIKTFSLGYGDYINELPFARQVSEKLHTDHYEIQANVDLITEFEAVLTYFDEPHADSSNFPQHLLSELASSKVKVALSGDGADELFLGYGWYWKFWNTRKIERIKNELTSSPFKKYQEAITMIDLKTRTRLWNGTPPSERTDRLVENMRGSGIQKINSYDLTTYLPGQLLSKVDRAGMMHSLEVRSPFLDHTLAEYVYNLPEKYKTDRRNGKLILKDILSEIMPKEFVYRHKQGFGAPVLRWLREDKFEQYLKAELKNPDAGLFAFLNFETVGEILDRFYTEKDDTAFYQLWILLTLAVWLRIHHPELHAPKCKT